MFEKIQQLFSFTSSYQNTYLLHWAQIHIGKSCTMETGISDYHELISICKTTFANKSRKSFYRYYNNLDSKLFEETDKTFVCFLLKILKELLADSWKIYIFIAKTSQLWYHEKNFIKSHYDQV